MNLIPSRRCLLTHLVGLDFDLPLRGLGLHLRPDLRAVPPPLHGRPVFALVVLGGGAAVRGHDEVGLQPKLVALDQLVEPSLVHTSS